MPFQGKVVLVTGAAAGMGKEIATNFAMKGANLVLNDLNKDLLDDVVNSINNFNVSTVGIAGDISEESTVDNIVSKANEKVGTIDILVNNAGISPKSEDRDANIEDLSLDKWERSIAINVRSQFLTCKKIVPFMKQKKWGRIINIASQVARIKPASFVSADYVASKSAIIGLTRYLAVELAPHGITVNAICPGIIETGMVSDVQSGSLDGYLSQTPVNRMGTPTDVVNAVEFLAHPNSSFIVGVSLDVNGGFSMN